MKNVFFNRRLYWQGCAAGLLQAIADQSEKEISRGLIRLQAAEFLYETSLFLRSSTHSSTRSHMRLLTEAFYKNTACPPCLDFEAIERLYPDRQSEHVDLLAYHASRGELWEKAVKYLHQSGKKSVKTLSISRGRGLL